MIVDLNLQGKLVTVIGGGNEALKRITSLLKQKCEIIVISSKTNSQINKLAKSKRIILKNQHVRDASFLSKYKPDMVICTTSDSELNAKIILDAKRSRILAYSSDNPEESDFANPAIIDFENIIQIAVFTGGRSPAMSKKLKKEAKKIFKEIITKRDLELIKIQKIVRELAKEKIPTYLERKQYLRSVMADKEIDQLIKDGQLKKAERRAITILRDWK